MGGRLMTLLPSPTSPPAVNWLAAYWADDPRNRSNPNNPTTPVTCIRDLVGNKHLTRMVTYNQQLHFVTECSLLGGRNAWRVNDTDSGLTSEPWASSSRKFSLVVIAALDTNLTLGNFFLTYCGGFLRVSSSAAMDHTLNLGQANNEWSARVVPPYSQPALYRARGDRPTSSDAWLSINGTTINVAGVLSNNAYMTQFVFGDAGTLGYSSAPGYYGFLGVFDGDVTTDPEWNNFLTWVDSWYGFDPTAPMEADPPPISWRGAWLADDYTPETGSGSDVLEINGTVLTSAWNIGSTTITDLVMAARRGGASVFSDTDIAFAACYKGDVAAAPLWADFKSWVASKYGITVA